MFAVTERLLLRPGWPEDAPRLARAIGDPASEGVPSDAPWPCGVRDGERWLALPPIATRPSFLLFRRDTAELVGGLALAGGAEPQLRTWIARRWWGQGFATEAGRAAMALADQSLRLPRVLAIHAPDDLASARVLAKLGFAAAADASEIAGAGQDGPIAVRALARPRFGATPMGLAA